MTSVINVSFEITRSELIAQKISQHISTLIADIQTIQKNVTTIGWFIMREGSHGSLTILSPSPALVNISAEQLHPY